MEGSNKYWGKTWNKEEKRDSSSLSLRPSSENGWWHDRIRTGKPEDQVQEEKGKEEEEKEEEKESQKDKSPRLEVNK